MIYYYLKHEITNIYGENYLCIHYKDKIHKWYISNPYNLYYDNNDIRYIVEILPYSIPKYVPYIIIERGLIFKIDETGILSGIMVYI